MRQALALGVDIDIAEPVDPPLRPFPVTTCTTCGQHYFVHHRQGLRLHRRRAGRR